MEFKLCRPGAVAPFKKYETDAGWDLFSPVNFTLYPQVPTVVPLGLKVQLPKDTVLLIQGRSSLAFKFGVTTIGNVVDEGYTGEIHCCLIMSVVPPIHLGEALSRDVSEHYFEHQKGLRKLPVKAGDRVAQALLLKRECSNLLERGEAYEFVQTGRGEMGQGSTGR